MTDLAFQATYADWRLIKTRGVVQVIFEVPLANHKAVLNILGGMPDAAREAWFGIAPLDLSQAAKETNATASKSTPAKLQLDKAPDNDRPPAGAKRDWRDLQPAAQAGIRCAEPTFRAFLRETRGLDVQDKLQAEIAVRDICGVESRVEFSTNPAKARLWRSIDTAYRAWLAAERVGA